MTSRVNGGIPDPGRRLVLGFDAGCTTCGDVARRIEAEVGEKLEVRPLHDPQMAHWREEALGEDAPWAPTLVEVKGGEVRAWTGVGMGVRMGRALGPLTTWRLMQVLGEVAGTSVTAGAPAARTAAGLSRGRFLRGLAGGLFALSVLPAGSALASPAGGAGGVSGMRRVSPGDAVIGRLKRLRAVRAAAGNFGRPDWRRVEQARYAEGGQARRVYLIPYRNGENSSPQTTYLVVEGEGRNGAEGVVMRLHHGEDGSVENFSWYLPDGGAIATTELRDGKMVESQGDVSQRDGYQVQSRFRLCFILCLGANGRRCAGPCSRCASLSCALCFACGGITAVRCARRCRR